MERIPEFTKEEMQAAINRLKCGKARDSNGIRAEDIKGCDEETKEWIRQIFNEVLQQKDCTPESWRRIRIKVIYKKGDVQDAGNHRPICSLPALYKLFSTFLNIKHYPRLDQGQPPDQGGFRRSHQTVDHLMLHKMLEQRCREWGVPLYISTIDFKKAFDRIRHQSLWASLAHFGIEMPYIDLLKRLYAEQKGTVMTDKKSDQFEIKRGRKQGDPLSSLLFNTVLQYALEGDLKRWQEGNEGIR